MQQYHASAVEINGRAVLILGESGSGKSSLALELMAMGANLIGDDQVFLDEEAGSLFVSPHPNSDGRIEVRGIGIFKSQHITHARVDLVVSLNDSPQTRLPERNIFEHGSTKIAQYDIKGLSHMAAFIYLLLTQKLEIEPV